MGVINKLEITCGAGAPTIFPINLIDTNDAGINAILSAIAPSFGTYSYSHLVNGGSVISSFNASTPSGCKASFFKDGVSVTGSGNCCITINPQDLLSSQAGNTAVLGLDGKIYVPAPVLADIYVDGGSYSPSTLNMTLTDNSGTTPDVVIPLSQLRKTQTAITVAGIAYPIGTDFETILGAITSCCVSVIKTPLTVVIDPLVVQTTNLSSIVTDSAGNTFYIDGAGNVQPWGGTSTPLIFNNDLGVGTGGAIQTGFPLVRDTFTTGLFYREWSNNRTGVIGVGTGLVYGLNNYGLGSGFWDKALIGQGSATIGYYNDVTGNYSLANGYQNQVIGSISLSSGVANKVAGNYSQAFGYGNINNGTDSLVSGFENINSANYSGMFGYKNQDNGGNFNLTSGYFNVSSSATYCNLIYGQVNKVTGTNSLIGGYNNKYDAEYGATIGSNNEVSANRNNSLVAGNGNKMYGGTTSCIIGEFNTVEAGSDSVKIILGAGNIAKPNISTGFLIGDSNVLGNVTGSYTNSFSGAIGFRNKIVGNSSISIGRENTMADTVGNLNYTLGFRNAHNGTTETTTLIGNDITANNYLNAVVIGGATQLLGFYDVQPVARQSSVGITTVAQVVTALRNLGLVS